MGLGRRQSPKMGGKKNNEGDIALASCPIGTRLHYSCARKMRKDYLRLVFYHSFEECLQIMAQQTAYAGYIEIAAAEQLCGLAIDAVVAGTPYSPVPDPP